MYTRLTYSILLISFWAFGLNVQAQNSNSFLEKEFPGGPENSPAVLKEGDEKKSVELIYNHAAILVASFDNQAEITATVNGNQLIEQRIQLNFERETTVHAFVYGSSEALAAETRGGAQEKLALVRTSHGLSNNLRNNAIYDQNLDWMLELPHGTVIRSSRTPNGTTQFELTFTAKSAELFFRPRYYQKHKNLPHFQPWTYSIYKESITGWCSWWAYFREFTEEDHLELLEMWQKKNMADYGYRFIQIDDVYQGGNDRERKNCAQANGYLGGRPTTWLDWKKDLFPSGLTGYVTSTHQAGFDPAVWMGCFFSDEETVQEHPDWFVHDESGKPAAAPWVSYVLDATNPEVVEALIRPVFKGLKNAGIEYVKIDQLRHYLYDNLHNNLEWCRERGVSPDELLRAYLQVAREELGDDTFILSCWGVLPESIGLADACRIGGDGYGPVTLQQYNSWNGIVWRNDPDHCDVSPNKKGKDIGNVKDLEAREALERETIIRPALASIAGAMLMLSDKPEVYEDDSRIYGLRRSSPVLFSVPGQLYDFDPGKTDWLTNNKRTDITTGKHPSPIDGDQFGEVCTYWLNEFNTGFENWNVFHRLNWSERNQKSLEPVVLKFADLGLDSSKEYLVYEFWNDKMYGVLKGDFALGELEPYGLESLAIREKLDRPQLVSTNRHLSQGAAEIEKLLWDENSLKGRSRVVMGDEYVITIYVPEDYLLQSAVINGQQARTEQNGEVLKVSYRPAKTLSVQWEISFKQQ